MLTLGLSGSNEDDKKKLPTSPLASQSILLLLVLSNHCTAEKILHNPFREALLNAQNFQGINILYNEIYEIKKNKLNNNSHRYLQNLIRFNICVTRDFDTG